jgi:hypothetical protein
MFRYSTTFTPPAPALQVDVRNGQTGAIQRVLAKLDTAADGSIIPEDLVKSLELITYDEILAISFDGGLQRRASYLIDLLFVGRVFTELEVVSAPLPYLLLGRDVLNKVVIIFNGPQLTFEIR